jgi:hypothetical protein
MNGDVLLALATTGGFIGLASQIAMQRRESQLQALNLLFDKLKTPPNNSMQRRREAPTAAC